MPFYQIDISRVLFLDIETVSAVHNFEELSENWQKLWDEKTQRQRGEDVSAADHYHSKAGILAEFGKIVCISCGFFESSSNPRKFRLTSFSGDDEKDLLEKFAAMLHRMGDKYLLCGHNGKEFDFPYLARRMVIQEIQLPKALNISGEKPWNVPHLDTMELWKFGDYKNYTSLKLLAQAFGLPTPKDDIDGSMVGSVYWEENDLPRIVRYCEKDVVTLARVFMRMEHLDPLLDEEITTID